MTTGKIGAPGSFARYVQENGPWPDLVTLKSVRSAVADGTVWRLLVMHYEKGAWDYGDCMVMVATRRKVVLQARDGLRHVIYWPEARHVRSDGGVIDLWYPPVNGHGAHLKLAPVPQATP